MIHDARSMRRQHAWGCARGPSPSRSDSRSEGVVSTDRMRHTGREVLARGDSRRCCHHGYCPPLWLRWIPGSPPSRRGTASYVPVVSSPNLARLYAPPRGRGPPNFGPRPDEVGPLGSCTEGCSSGAPRRPASRCLYSRCQRPVPSMAGGCWSKGPGLASCGDEPWAGKWRAQRRVIRPANF
jgi:hypothetical protein